MTAENNTFGTMERKRDQAARLASTHCEEISKIVSQLSALAPRQNTADLADPLAGALATLQKDLKTPLVRLAAIGTTSSAKSSLLNFLAGVPLLPTGVQEKSAGSVRIIDSSNISLVIEETDGATWNCGEIEVSDPGEITEILDEIMKMYRDAVNSGEEIEAPSVLVHYPLNLAAILQLPEGFQLELMDLPGLKFTGDERNLRVMRQCADALCLVTLGSQETDPLRQEALVEEALEQVRTVGSPIERMLFVITRVDEFLLNEQENWPRNEDEYVEDRREAILAEINRQLPDAGIGEIATSRISPMPALASLELEDPEKRLKAYETVRRKYFGLILNGADRDPEKGLDPSIDLSSPRFQLWNDEDWEKVAGQLQETSGALNFLRDLRNHIAENLAAITLPPIMAQYSTTAEETGREIRDFANLIRASITQDFEGQKEKLAKTGAELALVNERATSRLKEFLTHYNTHIFAKVASNDQMNVWLEETAQIFPEFAVPGLMSLGQWPMRMLEAYLQPIQCLKERMGKAKPLPQNLPNRAELERAVQSLMRQGYDKHASLQGKVITVASPAARDALERAFKTLNRYTSKSMEACLRNEFAKQMDNVLVAFGEVQEAYLKMLDGMMENVPPEFAHVVQITPQALHKFTLENTNYSIDPDVVLRTSVRKFKESMVIKNLAEGGFWIIDGLINAFRKLTNTHERIEERERVEYNVELPAMEQLEKDMYRRFWRSFEGLQKQMLSAVEGQTGEFLENIRKCQDARIASYDSKLKEVMREKSRVVATRQIDIKEILANLSTAEEKLRNWQTQLDKNTGDTNG